MDVKNFWKAVLGQKPAEMRSYFDETAEINWHCTNEHFTVEEYIRANCEYPGDWDGVVERMEQIGEEKQGETRIVTVTRVFLKDQSASFHAVSFFRLKNDRILSLDEYWGDDGDAPQWRQEKKIGTKIVEG